MIDQLFWSSRAGTSLPIWRSSGVFSPPSDAEGGRNDETGKTAQSAGLDPPPSNRLLGRALRGAGLVARIPDEAKAAFRAALGGVGGVVLSGLRHQRGRFSAPQSTWYYYWRW
jgi:hypothetical protein